MVDKKTFVPIHSHFGLFYILWRATLFMAYVTLICMYILSCQILSLLIWVLPRVKFTHFDSFKAHIIKGFNYIPGFIPLNINLKENCLEWGNIRYNNTAIWDIENVSIFLLSTSHAAHIRSISPFKAHWLLFVPPTLTLKLGITPTNCICVVRIVLTDCNYLPRQH
jgi:hypothetical protein